MTDREMLRAAMRVIEASCIEEDCRSHLAIAERAGSDQVLECRKKLRDAVRVTIQRLKELPNDAWKVLDEE